MTDLNEDSVKPVKKRATRGMPRVRVSNGRYQVQVSYQGATYTISPGLPARDKQPAKVDKLVRLITSDLECGQFDTTLIRYYQNCNISQNTKKSETETLKPLSVKQCWEIFLNAKSATSAETTIKIYYRQIGVWVDRINALNLVTPTEIREYMESETSPKQAKKMIQAMSSATRFCKERDMDIETDLSLQGRLIRLSKGAKRTPTPFSDKEVAAIAGAFTRDYPQYSALVKFLFLTGCRSSEAVGLKWSAIHLESRVIRFNNAIVQIDSSEVFVEKGTKTGIDREFPINEGLYELLRSITVNPMSTYVFNINDEPIKHSEFTNQAWNPCLTSLEELGVIKARQRQYDTRATFITRALKSGIPIADVAKMVGNSPTVIMKHYAGVTERPVVPEFDFNE